MSTTIRTPATLQASLSGRYALEGELGRGGMATVYLARDLAHGRQVAVKVLLPELAASIGADRFLREIALGEVLQHPNIVGVLDAGDAAGQPYYVMPYVEGESLRDRLDRERQLSIETTLELARQVADALDYAHAHGIVHRDIKPENILLAGDRAWVADFGIARAVTTAGGEKLTRTGMAVGTPVYMSPEQALGGKDAGAASDIYSLGCVVFEMLAGDPPFAGANMMALLAKHSLETVPSVRIVRPSVPPEVEDAIFCALEKTPADRFRTAGEFAAALRGEVPVARRGRTGVLSVPAGAAATTPPARPPPRRAGRRLAVGGAAAAILLAGGLAAWRAADSRAARAAGAERAGGDLDPRRVAVLYFEDESEKRELAPLADGLTEALIGALAQVPSLYVVSRNGVAPFRGDSALDSAAHALKVGSLVVGRVRRTPRGVHVDVRLLDVASNTDVGAQGFDVGASAVGSLGDSVTARVSEFLRKQLGTRIELAERRNATASTQAWLALQRGERLRKDADAALAAGDLEAAVSALTAADATLASAESLDAAWAEAPALRAFVAAQRGRALRARPADAKVAVDSGIAHADRALGLDPRNADALEARGTLRYLRSQQLVSTDPAGSDLALVQAEGDLVASTGANPGQASAWATLSVLYYRKQSVQQANLAAQNAYRADAYLRSADAILTRLFWTSHDMESFQDAQRWCAEGTRRFPAQPFFTECQLWLLTTKLAAPDPPRAWALYRELKRVTPPARWPTDSLRGQIIVAMVLSREPALVDSARRVLDRTNASAELDPQREITGLRAVGRVFLHDYDAAVTDIETYLTSNPEHARGFKTNTAWWWRDPGLQNHPRFQRLLAGIR